MELPPLVIRSELKAAGYGDHELSRWLRTGELTALSRGVYLRGAPPDDPVARHVLAARAALTRLAEGAVCSHVTAAALHGLPVWRIPLDRVHLTRPARRSGSRVIPGLHVHAAPLSDDEVCRVAGMPVTSLVRTVVDLARTVGFEEAVVLADAALRGDDGRPDRGRSGPARPLAPDRGPLGDRTGGGEGLWVRQRPPLEADVLAAALLRVGRWPGAPAARRVVGFADRRSGSVGESRSRVAICQAGLPVPVLQWEVVDPAGGRVAYTDFGWPDRSTVGEFDGRVKYGRLLRPGQEAGDVVFEEKVREDRLRALGLTVVRWAWSDLADFTAVADRLRRHLGA